jgi:hypothetical protein
VISSLTDNSPVERAEKDSFSQKMTFKKRQALPWLPGPPEAAGGYY